MSMKSKIRVVLESVLPESAMTQIRKYHYLQKIRGVKATEETDLAIALKLLAPGDAAIDCGANFGLYTRFFGESVGPQGHVYSFEPIPSTFAVLSSNVRGLGLRHVTLINKAVSDQPGQLRMSVPAIGGGRNFYQAHILRPGESVGPNDREFTVEVTPIDTQIPSDAGIRLMKVDVEGHELPALSGALNLLRRDNPALLIEVSGSPDKEGPSAKLFALLAGVGYKAYASEGLSQSLRAYRAGMNNVNYFFLKDAHVSRLRENGVPVNG